jgi:hypothetical protein
MATIDWRCGEYQVSVRSLFGSREAETKDKFLCRAASFSGMEKEARHSAADLPR